MKRQNEAVPAMKLMKLRIATGLGLALFMATMIGGPVRVSHAQDDEGVTLASLAGNFAGRGSGIVTVCFSPGSVLPLISCSSVSPLAVAVPFYENEIIHQTRDAAGNSCGVDTESFARVLGTKNPAGTQIRTNVGTTTAFDPTTGSGTTSFSRYKGGSCIGAGFDKTGATLTSTGTNSYVVSDSGNRIEFIWTSYTSIAPVAGNGQGVGLSETFIRQ